MEYIVASKRVFFNAEEEKTELFHGWPFAASPNSAFRQDRTVIMQDFPDVFDRSHHHGCSALDRSCCRRACSLRRRHRSRLDPERTVREPVGRDAASCRQKQTAAAAPAACAVAIEVAWTLSALFARRSEEMHRPAARINLLLDGISARSGTCGTVPSSSCRCTIACALSCRSIG